MLKKGLCLALLAMIGLATGLVDPAAEALARTSAEAADLAEAARLRDERRWLDALAVYERLHAQQPDDDEIYRLRTLTLADLGGAEQAWRLYQDRPELFSAAERDRLEADRLARLVVWGALYAESEDTRLDEMQLAGQALQDYLNSLPPEQRASALRPRLDRIVALHAMERHTEVVAEYRALREEGVDIPAYALAKVGDSLLAERHPEEAVVVLEQAVAGMSDDFDSQLLLGYAYLESEDHERALAQIQALVDANEPWLHVEGARYDYPNWNRHVADTTLAMVLSYGDRLARAQQRLEELAAIAPNSADLQAKLGAIYSRRGWPQRALERQRMARTLEPRNLEARIGETESLLVLHRVDEARPMFAELLAGYPDHQHVQRLEEYWHKRLGSRWIVRAARGRTENGAVSTSPLGSRDADYSFYLESPLLADRWRLTAHIAETWIDDAETRVHNTRGGAGLLYAHDRLQVAVEVSQPFDNFSNRTSLSLSGDWRFQDTLNAYAGLYRADPQASLQARRFGITADSVEFGLQWTPSELGQLGVSFKHWDYDDDNRREALGLAGERRLLTHPHFQLTAIGDAYASRGSLDDAPYFNPSRDASWSAGLRAEHLVWRSYERDFRHRLTASAGQYWQEDFGTAGVPKLEYRHQWRFGMGRVLDYGVGWSRPVYDGERETYLNFDLEFRWGMW